MTKRGLTDTTAIGLVRHDPEPRFSLASSTQRRKSEQPAMQAHSHSTHLAILIL